MSSDFLRSKVLLIIEKLKYKMYLIFCTHANGAHSVLAAPKRENECHFARRRLKIINASRAGIKGRELSQKKKESIIKTWRCKVMDYDESSVEQQEGNRSRSM